MPQAVVSVKLGGEAGQGVESSGAGFARALARAGLHVFGLQDYMSRIRGGYNFFQVCASERRLYAHTNEVHVLIALTRDAIDAHLDEVATGGAVIYDSGLRGVDVERLEAAGARPMPMPINRMAEEIGGNRIMANTAATAAAASLIGLDFEYLEDVIRDNFGSAKGGEVAEANLAVAREAFDLAKQEYAGDFSYRLPALEPARRMLMHGNSALAFGAFASGCRFISGYPMTPATSILEWFAARSTQYPVVVKQTEDELAGILMAVGAAHTGARAMVATSGGGFSLMVETLGLAGMTETPIVVVEAQRGGPSTGLPTRTEQADLLFAINASQGEFPRFVLAPTTIEQCFEDGFRALNLAEKYQVPVIVMTDAHLATTLRTINMDELDLTARHIDRGKLMSDAELDQVDDYRRHALTDDGVSPRALPGHPNAVYVTTGDEHSEYGFIIEDEDMRAAQMQKRFRKLEGMRSELIGPEVYGPADAGVTLLGWGSTFGALRQAVDLLNTSGEGPAARLVQLRDIWPFPVDQVQQALADASLVVAVEQNYTGQLARLLREQTGIEVDARINKYTGRPFSPGEIVKRLKEEVLTSA